MQMQGKNFSFTDQSIYIGLDVHLKSWQVAIITESGYKEEFIQESKASVLYAHLTRKYPGGNYYSVYESGFTGLSTHYSLSSYGITNIVANASDIPTTQKERLHKTDKVDAMKLASSLKAGRLQGIYIMKKEDLSFRELVRYRRSLVRDNSRWKNRIKSYLYRHGIPYADAFRERSKHWSKKFVNWLEQQAGSLCDQTLLEYIDSYKGSRDKVASINKKIRQVIYSAKYLRLTELLMSIPGFGFCTTATFLSEMGDVERFANQKDFASFIGIVPMSHNSGEKESSAGMTFRGNKHMRKLLIEASWIAIRQDLALGACYSKLAQPMNENQAIIRIAHKLTNRVLSVLKTGQKYQYERNN